MKLQLPGQAIVCRNLVGGSWIESSGSAIKVVSPYTNQSIGEVPLSTTEEVAQVAAQAQEAFTTWRRTPIKERCNYLFKLREVLLARADTIAQMAAAEAGKTHAEAKAGLLKGIEVLEFALSIQNSDLGGAIEVSRGVVCQYERTPLGVVAGIAPFNFPAMVPLWMYPIAIAMGNTFILKPSEKVPLTSQIIGSCFIEAGFPPGVFSIINGGKEVVQALIDNTNVKAIGFVGSTPVAKSIYQAATNQGKRCLALGGAKNHLLLMPDADPAITVRGIVDSFTGCAGQRCMAASLLLAVGPVDHLIDAIKTEAAKLRLGDDMGAIISTPALERMKRIIANAPKEGAKIILDGRRPDASSELSKEMREGNWLAPTIIDEASPTMECASEEIFGPVLTIVRVPDLAHAMAIENASPYGNATSVFTTNGAVARYVAETATTGMVGVNIGVPVPREPFSFGGTKDSKFGHGDITGQSALDFWSDKKKITTKWSLNKDTSWMS